MWYNIKGKYNTTIFGADIMDAYKNFEIIDCSQARYVSEGIGNDYEKWCNHTPVLICAPTGSGKNTFVLDILAPYVKSRNSYILLLGNRTALNLQQKRILWNRTYSNPIPDSVLADIEEFENVITLSYQEFGEMAQRQQLPDLLRYGISHVVFDEAHFFLSDARFNANTQFILQTALCLCKDMIRIYMTATPRYVKDTICEWEANLFSSIKTYGHMNYNIATEIKSALNHKKSCMKQYDFKPNFDNCTFKYFSDWNIIAQQIAQSNPDEKWLVFINAKQEHKIIEKLLKDNGIKSADIGYTDSSKKGGQCYKEIVSDGFFGQRILITTSVIDNGVTIKDDALKHIVVHSLDSVSAVQMVGRKRRAPDENVTYHFMIPTKDEIAQSIKQSTELLNFIKPYGSQQFLWQLHNQWGDLSDDKQKLFRIIYSQYPQNQQGQPSADMQFELNRFAEIKLMYDIGSLEEMETTLRRDPNSGIQKMILSWFGNPMEYSDEMKLEEDTAFQAQQLSKVVDWLDTMVEKGPLTGEEVLVAEGELAVFYKAYLYKKMSTSSQMEGTNRVVSKINNALKALALSDQYELIKLAIAENKKYGKEKGKGNYYWLFQQQ